MAKSMRKHIQTILDEILDGKQADRAEICGLKSLKGADLWDLIAAAGRVREHFRGSTVDICSIVNAKSPARAARITLIARNRFIIQQGLRFTL